MQGVMCWASRGTLVLAVALAGVPEPSLGVSPEEFAAMDAEAALQLPVVETLSVFGWSKQEFVFVLENALIDLRYLYRAPSGHVSKELTAAVKAFQRDLGARPTGVLLVSQFIELTQRGNEFWQAPIYPGLVSVSQAGDVIFAQGTWASDVDDPDPIRTTSIRCYRSAGLCSSVTAKVLMADESSHWFHSSAADLVLSAQDWKITESTPERLVAEDVSMPCVAYMLVIDTEAQTATRQSRPTAGDKCSGAQEPARTHRLANGFEVTSRYWDNRQTRLLKLRSTAFQKLVEKIQKRNDP